MDRPRSGSSRQAVCQTQRLATRGFRAGRHRPPRRSRSATPRKARSAETDLRGREGPGARLRAGQQCGRALDHGPHAHSATAWHMAASAIDSGAAARLLERWRQLAPAPATADSVESQELQAAARTRRACIHSWTIPITFDDTVPEVFVDRVAAGLHAERLIGVLRG